MTEKEKAAAGYLYNPTYDMELARDIAKCKELCFEYNNLKPSTPTEDRKKMLIQLFGDIGENAMVWQPIWCDYGYNTFIGKDFFSNHNLYIMDGGKVTIGNHVFIGPNCCIATAEHAIDAEQRDAGLEVAKPITIGNHVWLGAGVTVLGGVTIGDNTVIGAGSVVTKSIPENVIAVGNPCKVLREITQEDRDTYAKDTENKSVTGERVTFHMVDEFTR